MRVDALADMPPSGYVRWGINANSRAKQLRADLTHVQFALTVKIQNLVADVLRCTISLSDQQARRITCLT